MNSNLAKVGKPTRWPPGKSGNPAGKPPGTRTAFSQGFIRDFALVWAEEGLEAVRKVAKTAPEGMAKIRGVAKSHGGGDVLVGHDCIAQVFHRHLDAKLIHQFAKRCSLLPQLAA